MINYIPYKKIDKSKWDRCVDADPEATVFFYSWFLDTVCEHWDGLVAGDYDAVFPLPYKSKIGISYIIQPFFTRTIDICSADSRHKNIQQFMNLIPDKFRLQDFCVEGLTAGTEKHYQALMLNKPFEVLKKYFSTNTIQNLKKAEKNNLTIHADIGVQSIADDFKKINGEKLKKFGMAEYRTFKRIMEQCLEHQMGYTREIKNPEGNRLASAFFMHAHNRIIYLKGSSTDKGRKTGAMHQLMTGMIREFSNREIIFDFGGSSVPSVARFFRGFGATDHIYFAIRKNNLPSPLRWLKEKK